jgi:hypothetical protein
LPKRLSTHASVESFDGIEAETWPNLDKHKLIDIVIGCELLLLLVEYLIVTEPDAIIQVVEREDVIDEWLALWMVFWCVEDVREHLFGKLKVRLLGIAKCRIE